MRRITTMAGKRNPGDPDPTIYPDPVAPARRGQGRSGPPPAISGRLIAGVAAVIAACVALVLVSQFFHRVDPGFAGVKIDYGSGTINGKPRVTSLATGPYVFLNT